MLPAMRTGDIWMLLASVEKVPCDAAIRDDFVKSQPARRPELSMLNLATRPRSECPFYQRRLQAWATRGSCRIRSIEKLIGARRPGFR